MPRDRGCEKRYCSVRGCGNFQRGIGGFTGVSFHVVPAEGRDAQRRQLWIQALVRANNRDRDPGSTTPAWAPSSNTVVCSAHFVTGAPNRASAHPDYAPTLFPPNAQIRKTGPMKHWKPGQDFGQPTCQDQQFVPLEEIECDPLEQEYDPETSWVVVPDADLDESTDDAFEIESVEEEELFEVEEEQEDLLEVVDTKIQIESCRSLASGTGRPQRAIKVRNWAKEGYIVEKPRESSNRQALAQKKNQTRRVHLLTKCCVAGCPNSLRSLKVLSLSEESQKPFALHPCPDEDQAIVKVWLEFTYPEMSTRERARLRRRTVICSDHFLNCDKYPIDRSWALAPFALPCINKGMSSIPYQSLQHIEKKEKERQLQSAREIYLRKARLEKGIHLDKETRVETGISLEREPPDVRKETEGTTNQSYVDKTMEYYQVKDPPRPYAFESDPASGLIGMKEILCIFRAQAKAPWTCDEDDSMFYFYRMTRPHFRIPPFCHDLVMIDKYKGTLTIESMGETALAKAYSPKDFDDKSGFIIRTHDNVLGYIHALKKRKQVCTDRAKDVMKHIHFLMRRLLQAGPHEGISTRKHEFLTNQIHLLIRSKELIEPVLLKVATSLRMISPEAYEMLRDEEILGLPCYQVLLNKGCPADREIKRLNKENSLESKEQLPKRRKRQPKPPPVLPSPRKLNKRKRGRPSGGRTGASKPRKRFKPDQAAVNKSNSQSVIQLTHPANPLQAQQALEPTNASWQPSSVNREPQTQTGASHKQPFQIFAQHSSSGEQTRIHHVVKDSSQVQYTMPSQTVPCASIMDTAQQSGSAVIHYLPPMQQEQQQVFQLSQQLQAQAVTAVCPENIQTAATSGDLTGINQMEQDASQIRYQEQMPSQINPCSSAELDTASDWPWETKQIKGEAIKVKTIVGVRKCTHSNAVKAGIAEVLRHKRDKASGNSFKASGGVSKASGGISMASGGISKARGDNSKSKEALGSEESSRSSGRLEQKRLAQHVAAETADVTVVTLPPNTGGVPMKLVPVSYEEMQRVLAAKKQSGPIQLKPAKCKILPMTKD